MSEEKKVLSVEGYSYDCDEDTLVIELNDEPGSIEISAGEDFVTGVLSDVEGLKAGEFDQCGDVLVTYDEATDTFSVAGVENIDSESLLSELECIYNTEF